MEWWACLFLPPAQVIGEACCMCVHAAAGIFPGGRVQAHFCYAWLFCSQSKTQQVRQPRLFLIEVPPVLLPMMVIEYTSPDLCKPAVRKMRRRDHAQQLVCPDHP